MYWVLPFFGKVIYFNEQQHCLHNLNTILNVQFGDSNFDLRFCALDKQSAGWAARNQIICYYIIDRKLQNKTKKTKKPERWKYVEHEVKTKDVCVGVYGVTNNLWSFLTRPLKIIAIRVIAIELHCQNHFETRNLMKYSVRFLDMCAVYLYDTGTCVFTVYIACVSSNAQNPTHIRHFIFYTIHHSHKAVEIVAIQTMSLTNVQFCNSMCA